MSTYWYFRCDECGEWSDVVARDSKGVVLMDNKYTNLNEWLEKHQGHRLRFGNEHWRTPQAPWFRD